MAVPAGTGTSPAGRDGQTRTPVDDCSRMALARPNPYTQLVSTPAWIQIVGWIPIRADTPEQP